MSGHPSGDEAAELLRMPRRLCSSTCARLVEVAWWAESGHGCFASWSCLLHWTADTHDWIASDWFAFWQDDRWVVGGWIDPQGNDWLREWHHPDYDIEARAGRELLGLLRDGGWALQVPAPEGRHEATAPMPPGLRPGTWSWLCAVLVDEPTGIIAPHDPGLQSATGEQERPRKSRWRRSR